MQNRFFDDSGHVGRLNMTVPNPLGINDHGRPQLALIEAPGLVGSDADAQSPRSELGFEAIPQGLLAIGIATAAAMARLAAIAADKDMMREGWHL